MRLYDLDKKRAVNVTVDLDRTREIPKMHLIDLGDGRGILKRLSNAKPYSACDLCKKKDTCVDCEISEMLGYFIVKCDLRVG